MTTRSSNLFNYDTWLRGIIRHPWIVVACILLLTVAAGYRLPSIKINTSSYEISVKDIPEFAAYEGFLKDFGGAEYIQVVAKADNIFEPETFARLGRMADRLGEIPGVQTVISLPGAKQDMDLLDEWTPAQFEKKVEPVDLFVRNIISKDKKTTTITLILNDIRGGEKELVQAVNQAVEAEKGPMTVYEIGMPLISQAVLDVIKRDFLILPPLAFAIMILTLIVLFRSVRILAGPLACITISIIWAFGAMAWTGTPVAALTLVVPIFLMAVGTAYCLHVATEYENVARNSKTSGEAALACLEHVRLPTTLAVFTTLIGLSSLMLNRTEAVREFAMPACIGMLSQLILILVLFPAILALTPLPKSRTKVKKEDVLDRLLAKIAILNLDHRKAALTVVGVITGLAILGFPLLRVDADVTKYLGEDVSVTKNFHDVYQDMAGCFSINVIAQCKEGGDCFRDLNHLQRVADLQRYLETLEGVDKTISTADYLKLINYSVNDYRKDNYALPETQADLDNLYNLYRMLFGGASTQKFISDDFTQANILMMTHISSTHDWLKTQKRIEKYCQENFGKDFSVSITSMAVIVAHSNKIVTLSLIQGLLIIICVVLGIMLVALLSPKAGLVTLLPNCFPLVVLFGAIGWFSVELSMNTAMVASIAIGLALDDTIHYMVRYSRELRHGLDRRKALETAIRTVGRPIIFTSVTITLGFLVLTFSGYKPTATFGALMALTMVTALVGDLVILPSMMLKVNLVTLLDLLRVKLGIAPDKGIPLFSGLSKAQIRLLLSAGGIRNYPKGHILMEPGGAGDSLFAVISGEVALYHTIPSRDENSLAGARIRLATLKPGDVIGEMGTSTQWHGKTATLMATTYVELLEINPGVVKRIQWLSPPTAYKFMLNLVEVLAQRLENTTQRLAGEGYRDAVTGLINPASFERVLEKELHRVKRYGSQMALGIVEIRNLHAISSHFGLHTGDQVLAHVSRVLGKRIREFDTLCRLDEHHFGMLLVRAGDEGAGAIVRRLSALLNQDLDKDLPRLEVAVGFTVYSGEEDTTTDQLLAAAHKSLELDKDPDSPTLEALPYDL
ncbi:MAG: MMPL family transporter [Desulfatibacillum sp.]|nr:MMPL family transporter [Desulfatibacillum sp.]